MVRKCNEACPEFKRFGAKYGYCPISRNDDDDPLDGLVLINQDCEVWENIKEGLMVVPNIVKERVEEILRDDPSKPESEVWIETWREFCNNKRDFFETECEECGNTIIFIREDVYSGVRGGEIHYYCANCNTYYSFNKDSGEEMFRGSEEDYFKRQAYRREQGII